MNITKCDLCKKEIKERSLKVGFDFWVGYVELCKKCSEPVAKFLEENKLTKKKK